MLKRIAALMVMFTMVFAFQSNVWAAAVHAEDTLMAQQTEVIALAENPQLAALNQDLQLLGATGFGGMKIEPWFWALSIVIPGLGQFLMGDVVRGLLFFFGPTLFAIAGTVVGGILLSAAAGTGNAAAAAGTAGIVGLVLSLGALAIYIWNVVDAYFMNQEKSGMASIDHMDRAAQLQVEVAKVAEFVQKNQLVASQNGLGVNSQLATF
ncbi:MAG: hypothetical protein ACO1RX_09175 [Candidatus Sericytochromatia bacterium]